VNNAETQDPANPTADKRKMLHMLGGDDLTGRAVVIDISGRVQAELDKNGGKPSPDTGVTNFSNNSGNVVTADDVAGVADRLDNGVWLVLNQGWSRFYFQGADVAKDPYINDWNFPGMTPAAIDKLIEIENAKGIRINGIISFVENATNQGQLSLAKQGSCTIVVGAPKHVRGAGGPSRVIAICEK
jgi:kynurenine formamidase